MFLLTRMPSHDDELMELRMKETTNELASLISSLNLVSKEKPTEEYSNW